MPETDFTLRKAVPAQSRVLAELMNIAGEGLPAHLWAGDAAPGEDVIDVGARRVARSYINAVATAPGFRGRGVGSRLLRLAEALAREAGATTLSLIVAEANAGAKRLYEKLGYAFIARRPIVPFPGAAHDGDWILMTKPLPVA